MKKILIAILTVAMLFSVCCMTSCSSEKKIEVVNLVCDKTEAAPGETVKLTVHMNEYDSVACFSYTILADEFTVIEDSEQLDSGDFIVSSSNDGNNMMIAGIVPTVSDVKGLDLYEITYKISDDAQRGKKQKITLDTTQFLIGKDKNGDVTEDIYDAIASAAVKIKIK